ncbi:type II toxin-antitoxin system RelE/ParE family toxin [Rhizobiales bacterium]|uniref:type II toxin-antitoxin system RelE/ParE family toxin n=1 Tax=Hongsoonwoonella zoysiae TaxID=2821844 RepID=UPI0015604065|nr:type II toxin-antitoxin system RelE/ParE family toxin [Hongsoonwoonella zoysiae]
MIVSFADRETENLFFKRAVRRFQPDIVRRARRKLLQIHAAVVVDDLRMPPGNRLEALKGSRSGQHSIRVNDQWRICFRFEDGKVYDVEICDYHK